MNNRTTDTLISFVIPVFNGNGTLEKCMDSLSSQGVEYPYEIVLIDDGSTDGSDELIDHFADYYERVSAVHQSNEGHTAARLSGLRKACGEYVFFVDCDDIAEPTIVGRLAEIILSQHPDIVMFSYSEMTEAGDSPVSLDIEEGLYDGERLEDINSRMLIMDKNGRSFPRALWSKIIRRDLAEEALESIPPGILTGEDMCASINAFLHCRSLYVLDEPLYRYRVSRTAQWRSDPKAFRRCLSIVDYLYRCTKQRSKEYEEQYYRLTVQQVFSAAQRASRSTLPKDEFLKEYHAVLADKKVADAVRLASFRNIKLKLKQIILRLRLYRPIKLFDKKAVL